MRLFKGALSVVLAICLMVSIVYFGEKKWDPIHAGFVESAVGEPVYRGVRDTAIVKGCVITSVYYTRFRVFVYLSPSGDQASRLFLLNKGVYSHFPDTIVYGSCSSSPQ
jgi:hypothetical protein